MTINRVRCTSCGVWKDPQDFTEINDTFDYELGNIVEGECDWCRSDRLIAECKAIQAELKEVVK